VQVTAKINYLYHSGFTLSWGDHFLVFDYYMDSPDSGRRILQNGIVGGRDFVGKKGIVFVSHAHSDHFNPCIFKWRESGQSIRYVLSSDIRLPQQAHYINEGEELTIDGLHIRAFGSTDAGVSFLIEGDGLSIFHAGDFNLWHWQEESTPQQVAQAKYAFLQEIKKMKELFPPLDIAFFPCDPRMKKGYWAGAAYFARTFQPKMLIPMHFGAAHEACDELIAQLQEQLQTKVIKPVRRGQEIIFEK